VKSVPAERLLSVREVAARLGVCTSTIYNLCREGKLLHVRVSNAIRVATKALEDLMPGGARSGVAYSAGLRPR
jgi:excisionase family DNA binding protein